VELRARRRLLAALLVALGAGGAARADEAADAIVGVWETAHTENGWAHVEIARRGDAYDGTIVWIDEELYRAGDPMAGRVKVDRENPDPALRARPILGLTIVRGLRHVGGDRWDGGTIYDPESGRTYRSKAVLADGGSTLKLRGFLGISLLGRTSAWKRLR
jgi:uncharacterized protein (DUF2147 family)